MAKMSGRIAGLMMVLMTLMSCRIGAVNGASYTVGDSSGWSMGADYTTWAADKTFKVGDTLVFNYPSGHTVDEVSKEDYQGCTSGNTITSDSSGATSVPLKTAGTHYFICGAPGHCSGGMKLAVTVAAASSGGTPAGATTPSSDTATSPPSSTTPTTTSPTAGTTITNTPTTGTLNHPSSSAAISPAAAALSALAVVAFKLTFF